MFRQAVSSSETRTMFMSSYWEAFSEFRLFFFLKANRFLSEMSDQRRCLTRRRLTAPEVTVFGG